MVARKSLRMERESNSSVVRQDAADCLSLREAVPTGPREEHGLEIARMRTQMQDTIGAIIIRMGSWGPLYYN